MYEISGIKNDRIERCLEVRYGWRNLGMADYEDRIREVRRKEERKERRKKEERKEGRKEGRKARKKGRRENNGGYKRNEGRMDE